MLRRPGLNILWDYALIDVACFIHPGLTQENKCSFKHGKFRPVINSNIFASCCITLIMVFHCFTWNMRIRRKYENKDELCFISMLMA